MLDLQGDVCGLAIRTAPAPLLQQILAHLVAVKFSLLIGHAADLGILHQLRVEAYQLHTQGANRAERTQPSHPGQARQHAMRETWSQPACLSPPVEKARLPVAGLALPAASADGSPGTESSVDGLTSVPDLPSPHHPCRRLLHD